MVSLPVSFYAGGLVGGWLLGILGSATAMGAKVAIVKHATMGLTGSLIRGGNPLRGAFEGAVFAGVGYGVGNAPVLANTSDMFRDVARGVSAGLVQSALHGGNFLQNAVVGGVAAGVGALVVPGPEAGLTLEGVAKVMAESATAVG